MGEVRYSVNGKYFRDWNVYVSDSEGLFDALKRKKVNSYQWAEYHGQSVDLSNPKYEAREITLKCFVVGDNWVAMKANFDALISEFQKSGTQRLLIEPFGLKPLPYEVYMEDSSELQKTFREGKMAGVFALKLIEPNPIKKVLYLTGSSLNLAYNSPKETEIFYGNGLKETASGNVSLSGKTLADRVVSGYAFEGRNLIRQSDFTVHGLGNWGVTGGVISNYENEGLLFQLSSVDQGIYSSQPIKAGETYTLSIWTKATYQESTGVRLGFNGGDIVAVNIPTSNSKFTKTSVNLVANNDNDAVIIYNMGGVNNFFLKYIKLEKGTVATPYSIAPEDEKIIIIAGNVDEITGLTTNAEVLWEKL